MSEILTHEEWLLAKISGETKPDVIFNLHATIEALAEALRGELYDTAARCADDDCKQCARTNALRDKGWLASADE